MSQRQLLGLLFLIINISLRQQCRRNYRNDPRKKFTPNFLSHYVVTMVVTPHRLSRKHKYTTQIHASTQQKLDNSQFTNRKSIYNQSLQMSGSVAELVRQYHQAEDNGDKAWDNKEYKTAKVNYQRSVLVPLLLVQKAYSAI